jgi:hypothetical protein
MPSGSPADDPARLLLAGDDGDLRPKSLANPLASGMQKALSLFEKGPLALVAGAGFEPATSGL